VRAEISALRGYHQTEGGRRSVHEPDRDEARSFVGGFKSTGSRRIEIKEIFRRLIAQEVRSGRLTPSRRRRIVRYAAQLHLSAVETGRLIAECREEALHSEDPEEIYHALRLVEPPPATMPWPLKAAIALAGAVVVNLVLSKWL
jgi:hypothetical protein